MISRTSVASLIDPAAKLTWLLIVSVSGSILVNPQYLAIFTASILLCFGLCRLGELISAWKFRWIIIFIPGLLWIYHGIVSPYFSGQLWQSSPVKWSSAAYSLKILNSVLALVFLLSTTEIRQLVNRLSKLGMPSRAAFSVYLMLRFVEILRADAASVRDAMRLQRASPIRQFTRSAATLVLLGMHRAEQTSLAMDLRGFSSTHPRTYLGTRRWSAAGWLLPLAAAALLGALVLRPSLLPPL